MRTDRADAPADDSFRHRPGYALLLLLAAGLSACMVGPDYRKPAAADAPQDWTAWRAGMPELRAAAQRTGETPAERGWSVYDDPLLARLQRDALARNADLRSAALHYAEARMQRRIARAVFVPEVGAQGGVDRERLSESGSATRVVGALGNQTGVARNAADVLSEPFTLYQAGFDASWEPDLWGRVRRSVEASDAEVAASSALLDDARLSVTSEVARSYFEWCALQRQVEVTREQIANGKTRLALVAARTARGLTDSGAVEAERAALAQFESTLPQLESEQVAALNRLAILLDRRAAGIEPLLAGRNRASPSLPDLSAGLPSELARRRPDVAAAEASLHAATARIGLSVADLYPRITLGASFGYESTDGGRIADWGSRTWSVGPTLNLPVFDFGRRRATVTLRELQAQEAAVAWQHAVLGAWQDLDDALSRYGAERLHNAALRRRLHDYRELHALAQARYARGKTSELSLLDAERDLQSAERDVAVSDGSLRESLAVVIKAAGGGVDPVSIASADGH